jgi:hypothetical protein
VFWAPLGSEAKRIEFIRSWTSLGWTNEGLHHHWKHIVMEDELEPFRGYSTDYVILDEPVNDLPGSAESTRRLQEFFRARKAGE